MDQIGMIKFNFEPLLPLGIVVGLLVLPVILLAWSLFLRRRGSLLRTLCLASFIIALLGPVIIWQEREPTQATIALIVDRSQSQKFGRRSQQTDTALAQIKATLAQLPQFDTHLFEISRQTPEDGQQATHLFPVLTQAFADIQAARQGGIIMITDGQIHDLSTSIKGLGIEAPFNVLLTGYEGEYDRQIRLNNVPRFGLVGQPIRLSFMVEDAGQVLPIQTAQVTLTINGIENRSQQVNLGTVAHFEFDLPLAGNNIIELTTPVVNEENGKEELTSVNNRIMVVIEGIRENLKTLLVSGEPHAGLRLWRDLLKSDTGVDLVHFTILRPPEKFDNTPVHELSLISFPTTELFVDKIDEFDLIILDRYQHYDILPLIYYDFIAEYVKKGGALLLATGPEYANNAVSLANTPLISALPAYPTGKLIEQAFLPQLTPTGQKHPVTRDLEGALTQPPTWGRWLRQIEVEKIDENARILLHGADSKPLLLLGQKGQGRVGMILSDQVWLWAHGFEGGGPYANLYRRIAYWLLKQPELEEEALTATLQAGNIIIHRQTMLDENDNTELKENTLDNGADETQERSMATITLPSGEVVKHRLIQTAAGLLTGRFTSEETGLFRIEHGDKTTFVLIGSLDAPEFGEVVSTGSKVAPLVQENGGSILRLSPRDDENVRLPAIQIAKPGERADPNKIILRPSSENRLVKLTAWPLYSSFLALSLTLLLLGAAWQREGR